MGSPEPPPEDYEEEAPEGAPPPPQEEAPQGTQEVPPSEEGDVPLDRLWEDEGYEDLVVAEEPPPAKPRRRRRGRSRGLIAFSVVMVVLLLWTLISPQVLGPVGTKYVSSQVYADWGNYTGTRDTALGEVTWGISITSFSSAPGNSSMDLGVLVTKVSEGTANWFLRGTGGIELRGVSAYDENGTPLGTMENHSDLGFGVLAYLPVAFPAPGTYWIYVSVSFLVNEVMRVGYFPLEVVSFPKVWLDSPVQVELL